MCGDRRNATLALVGDFLTHQAAVESGSCRTCSARRVAAMDLYPPLCILSLICFALCNVSVIAWN
jgi:hypothetical protein